VGGFLSPQHLHPTARVVIDLRGDRFILVDAADADIATWLRDRAPDLVLLELARDPDEATPVVDAAVAPFAPVATMLNTGGRGTEFAVGAVPGLVGVPQEEAGKGVGGSPVHGIVVERQTLQVGEARFPVPRLLVRESIDTMLGLVGMDVLRGTILAVAAERGRPVWWLVPADSL
jgi:hypothetical protein